MFADLSELSRNRPAGEEISAEHPVHSPREYFHTYLQSLDVERAGLPETFQARLRRVLAPLRRRDLDRTPALEEAVFRIFLAQQRASADVAIVSTLLRQWLTEAPPAEALREQAGLALEHLIAATQVRFPVGQRPGPQRRVPLVRPAAAAPHPRRGLRPGPPAPALPRPEPGRAGPRRADRGDGRRLRAAGAAARPAHRPPGRRPGAAARGADPPLLRQQGPVGRPLARGRGLHVLHRRVRADGRPGWSPPPSTSRSWPTPCAPSASWPRTSRPARTWSPTSTCLGRPARRGRDGRPPRRGPRRAAAARARRPDHHHGGRAQRRR